MIQGQQLVTVSLTLVSAQTGLFFILLVCAVYKIMIAIRQKNCFMVSFFVITLLYILCELVIQILQIIYIKQYQDPIKNCNITLSLNVFCMIADMHLLLMLTLYWKEIEGSFIDTESRYSQFYINSKYFPYRLVIPFLWLLGYIGYFIYLNVSYQVVNSIDLGKQNQIVLYVIVQAVSMIMLIACGIWQCYHWCKIQNTIQDFQRIIPLRMNKTRYKTIFLITTVFNSIRTLFICFLIAQAHYEQYSNLIIGLNCFTLTATLPILFYLFGLKLQQGQNLQKKLIRQSNSSKKTSSAHQTQLSRTHSSHSQSSQKQFKHNKNFTESV